MCRIEIMGVFLIAAVGPVSWAGESMPSMPKLEPKRTLTVKGGEDFEAQKGFGDADPNVRMMNLMMVEGSGMEGMDMSGMAMGTPKETPAADRPFPYDIDVTQGAKAPKVGTNKLQVTIRDRKTNQLVKGLSLKAEVYMTSMDMGTETPAVREVSPGNYEIRAPFSMKGPWAVKLLLPDGKEKVLTFEVK